MKQFVTHLLIFHRKELCEVRPTTPSVFKFQKSFLYLSQMDPQWKHLVAKSSTKVGLVDLSSGILPVGHLVAKNGTMSSQLDIWSGFGSC